MLPAAQRVAAVSLHSGAIDWASHQPSVAVNNMADCLFASLSSGPALSGCCCLAYVQPAGVNCCQFAYSSATYSMILADDRRPSLLFMAWRRFMAMAHRQSAAVPRRPDGAPLPPPRRHLSHARAGALGRLPDRCIDGISCAGRCGLVAARCDSQCLAIMPSWCHLAPYASHIARCWRMLHTAVE